MLLLFPAVFLVFLDVTDLPRVLLVRRADRDRARACDPAAERPRDEVARLTAALRRPAAGCCTVTSVSPMMPAVPGVASPPAASASAAAADDVAATADMESVSADAARSCEPVGRGVRLPARDFTVPLERFFVDEDWRCLPTTFRLVWPADGMQTNLREMAAAFLPAACATFLILLVPAAVEDARCALDLDAAARAFVVLDDPHRALVLVADRALVVLVGCLTDDLDRKR